MPKDADHPGWRIHPAPDGRGAPARPRRLRAVLGWTAVAVALIAVNVLIASRMSAAPPRVAIPYAPDFIGQVRAGNVAEVVFRGEAIDGTFRSPVAVPAADPSADPATDFTTRTPPGAGDPALVPLLLAEDVAISARDDAGGGTSTWLAFLLGAGPIVIVLGAMALLMRRAGRGPSGAAGASPTGTMGMGRARARRYEATGQHVTFADVAGIDEAKAELTQIVGFLKDPGRYRALGARLPRGVLLTGPPGTGQTLLARAIAGEAGVPFFSMSASEFIEMIVGVGASRVRDLFAQAKAAAPAIVFIDELDAVGRSRTAAASLGGGSDEREQTLNQILTEMDGFEPSTGVIVLGATNRPDILDSALLRAGRFDRRVAVQPPDRDGRLAILNVHVRGVPLAPDTDLAAVAARTPGMVGADLAGLVNEAALLAADRGHRDVGPGDVDDALEKIVLGGERRIVMSRAERERTAYHEAGHALVGMLSPLADPVRKISIIPRGTSLGVTYAAPDADRYSYTREDLRTRIRVALGGRAAEELVYGEISTGAEADIDQLTDIARRMAGRWGMSDAIGPVALIPPESRAALVGLGDASARARHLLDAEVRRIIDDGHREAVALLTANRDRLESLTRALLAAETLDRAAAYAAAGLGPPPDVAAVPGPVPVTA